MIWRLSYEIGASFTDGTGCGRCKEPSHLCPDGLAVFEARIDLRDVSPLTPAGFA